MIMWSSTRIGIIAVMIRISMLMKSERHVGWKEMVGTLSEMHVFAWRVGFVGWSRYTVAGRACGWNRS